MLSSLILSTVNAGLSMVWILAFNVYIALWTKATETAKSKMGTGHRGFTTIFQHEIMIVFTAVTV